jgi:hypothetical protein
MAYKLNCDITDPEIEQVMLDIETMSTQPNAVIVSIGATKFSLSKGIIDTLSVNIDPADSRKYGLHICSETVDWWKKQDKDAIAAWRTNPQSLKNALNTFTEFYGSKSITIYGNSANFDVSILESSYKALNISVPWKFRDITDYRTICKLFPDVEVEYSGIKHGALSDAINQTNHLIKLIG